MKNPLVSIIVPNYNGEQYIKESIKSVIKQTYKDIEIIVVDDGSTDSSEKIVKSILDHRLIFISRGSNYPKGGNSCRNLGLQLSHGEYVIFLDSDDLLGEKCVENRINYLSKHENLDFAVFNTYSFVNNIEDGHVFTRLNIKDPISHFICTDNLWQTASVIWKRSFVIGMGAYNLGYQRLQDPEMTLRAFFASCGNYKLVSESEADTYYRRPLKHSRSKQDKSYKAMVQFIRDFYTQNNAKSINHHNTMFMYLVFTSLHLKCWSAKDELREYVECIKILSHYNKDIISTWYNRFSLYRLKRPYVLRKVISSIVGKKSSQFREKYLSD